VIEIFLTGYNITSTLPPAIGELDQLQTLSIMNMPGLHGPIADTFGNLAHLSIFNLMVTSISGPIPSSLSRTNLTSVSFLPEQAHRHHPEVAAAAAVPDLLRRRLQRPRGAHPAAAGARQHAGPAPGPDAGREPAVRDHLLDVRAGEELDAVQGGQQQARRGPVVPVRAAEDDGRDHGPVREQVQVQPDGGGVAPAPAVPQPQPQPIYGGVPASLRDSKVAVLDLSYNQLCGQIPTGGHMVQFKAAAYEHNKCQLCGTPLPPCANGS
jgi:beta-glucosidase